MNDYRYILQPYTGRNSRHTCPGCNKPHQFSRYIDTNTGESVADHVGECNRINKCGYHYSPKQYFQDNNFLRSRGDAQPVRQSFSEGGRAEGFTSPTIQRDNFLPWFRGGGRRTEGFSRGEAAGRGVTPPTYINKAVFLKTLSDFVNNNFVKYLHSRFNAETVNQLISDYHIGTSSRWNGGTTIFWQVDINGNVRSGKLIKYDAETGKRDKNKTNWVHSVMNIPDFNLKQCFFGEHLLSKHPDKVVGIVESEKTAILASVFLPQLVWLASGGANGINKEKVKVLRGREAILFPDASSSGEIYNNWCDSAKKHGFACSDFIEKYATNVQKVQGIDIADLLECVSVQGNNIDRIKIPAPFNTNPAIEKLVDTFGFSEVKITPLYEWKKEPLTYPKATPNIPYNTPSPVAVIDSKIDTNKVLSGKELVVKSRIFTSNSGDKIELVGLRDYGFCKNWESHKKQKDHCKECILNCLHTIKINGNPQQREYSQLEVLLMQN